MTSFHERRQRLAAILFGVLLTSCGGQSLEFTIEQALITSPEGARFSEVIDGDWDRVCIFRPYTATSVVDSALGARWRGADETGIATRDDATLVVFARNSDVVSHVMYPRHKGDFGTPGPESWYCLPRDRAVFQLRQPIDGSIPWIGPVDPT